MKFKDLEIGDTFNSVRYENITFTKIKETRRTCCTPAHNAVGVNVHNTKVLFAQEDEVEKIQNEAV